MASVSVTHQRKFWGNTLTAIMGIGVITLGWLSPAADAKEPVLNAIELYDGPAGAAYVQLTEVLINGKVELRSCGGPEPIDKSSYGKLQKVTLAVGGVLERGNDGVLRYGPEGQGGCVVPDNVKFEHNAVFSPAAMADVADLRGRAIASGTDAAAAPQPLKKGVKILFVAAPNLEQAEYMLAQRVGTEAAWQSYLGKYASAPHTDAARKTLTSLYVAAGEKSLSAYEKTASTETPSYADLKKAEAELKLAHGTVPYSEGEVKLAGEIKTDLGSLAARAQSELDAYNAALTSNAPGFVHLEKAKNLSDAINDVDFSLPAAVKLKADVAKAADAFEVALRTAEGAVNVKQWDAAAKAIDPYRSFAAEQLRVSKVVDSIYSAYLVEGQQLEDTKDWPKAIHSLKNALKVKDTAEVRDALKGAEKEYGSAQDQTAATAALEKSKLYESQKELIPAYEVLTNLPDGQRLLVKDDITRLAPIYVQAASQKAKEIAVLYPDIKGMGDEKSVEQAYAYLQRAYELSDEESLKQAFDTRMKNLGDVLSGWFLERAKHSLQKPRDSESELGWAFLKEAESYKAANLEAVRDQMKIADAAHTMHSRLSIRVQFRDQTSQRQSAGFANQMESAIAVSLENSGVPVKVVRSGDTVPQDVEPDFLIAGDVLEHHIAMPSSVESVDSKYRAGVHEVPSEEWNKANRVYDSATNELHTAQAALQGATAKGNKKLISEASARVADAQEKVDSARVNLDSIARSKTEDIIRDYTYKKVTYDVIDRVVIQIRVDDVFSGERGEPVQVTKEEKKQFVVLTDVKGEDANGIKEQGAVPEPTELQTALDNVAREELTSKVHQKVLELPHKIYDAAHKKELEGYPDDAGERYMRYLDIASPDQLAERDHAQKFLKEQFNFPFTDVVKPAPALEQGMAQTTR